MHPFLSFPHKRCCCFSPYLLQTRIHSKNLMFCSQSPTCWTRFLTEFNLLSQSIIFQTHHTRLHSKRGHFMTKLRTELPVSLRFKLHPYWIPVKPVHEADWSLTISAAAASHNNLAATKHETWKTNDEHTPTHTGSTPAASSPVSASVTFLCLAPPTGGDPPERGGTGRPVKSPGPSVCHT